MIRRRVSLSGGWAEASFDDGIRVGDRVVPRSCSAHIESVDGQPAVDLSIEIRGGLPECVELKISTEGEGRGIRQLDLAAVDVARFVEDVVASLAFVVVDLPDGNVRIQAPAPDKGDVLGSVEALRRARIGKGARRITPEFLERVAEVYRENIAGNPTKAVGVAFAVRPRTASSYVELARAAGLLAATTQGKKGV